jgi:hypothetical protein
MCSPGKPRSLQDRLRAPAPPDHAPDARANVLQIVGEQQRGGALGAPPPPLAHALIRPSSHPAGAHTPHRGPALAAERGGSSLCAGGGAAAPAGADRRGGAAARGGVPLLQRAPRPAGRPHRAAHRDLLGLGRPGRHPRQRQPAGHDRHGRGGGGAGVGVRRRGPRRPRPAGGALRRRRARRQRGRVGPHRRPGRGAGGLRRGGRRRGAPRV